MHAQPGDRSCANEAIGGNHFGPVLIYMSKVDDASSADGSGDWFKVDEFGYDASSKTWGTDLLNENCGKRSFKIPSKIPAGDYLVRAEAIALHTAGQQGGAQFYMSCYVSCFLSRFCRSLGRGFPANCSSSPSLSKSRFLAATVANCPRASRSRVRTAPATPASSSTFGATASASTPFPARLSSTAATSKLAEHGPTNGMGRSFALATLGTALASYMTGYENNTML